MTLINCPECNHSISSECIMCPNCGYGMKRKKKINVISLIKSVFKENEKYVIVKGKIELTSLQFLALTSLICSFVLLFINISFVYKTDSVELYYISQLDVFFTVCSTFECILCCVFALLSLISIIISNALKKIKKILLLIPNTLYFLFIAIKILTVLIDSRTYEFNMGEWVEKWYTAKFGAFYILILALLSLLLLFWNYKKTNKK